jgi:cell division protein FtsQ
VSTRSTTVREPLAAAAARFEARARAARWRARRPLLALGAAAMALVVLSVLAWFGPLLSVRDVEVRGVSGPEVAQVRAIAIPTTGTPLPRVDTGLIARQVERLPYVASARVERGWPWTLRVVVQHRVAVAAVPATRGQVQLVDADGVAFAKVAKAPSGVPVVRVPIGAAGRDALRATLTVLAGLPPTLRAGVSQVSADTADDVQMRWRRSTVVWGSADDTALKAEVLMALSRTAAAVYDVSSPHTPVLR